MIEKNLIIDNLNKTLKSTKLTFLGNKKEGKVRDIYRSKNHLFLIATDRVSAFDRAIAAVPYKGEILTKLSEFWFHKTKKIIKNHLIGVFDPNIMVCKPLKIFPIEVVVRGYLTGVTSTSLWYLYSQGTRKFWGEILKDGMKKNEAFSKPLVTPTTKSNKKDEGITSKEIINFGVMTKKQWDQIYHYAIALFQFGSLYAKDKGLILVDTKYEFGTDEEGQIYLCDEIHTADSSRYWLEKNYLELTSKGLEPFNLDKEYLRKWCVKNKNPYLLKKSLEVPSEVLIELAQRYFMLYEKLTDNVIKPDQFSMEERMMNSFRKKGYL